MLDLVIENGLVHDGRGSPPRRADVGIRDGRVVAIAPGLGVPARERRDASGCWVTPGFVDIHTHYDLEVEVAPGLAESVRHGVTTVVMGNCSLSLTVGDPAVLADVFLRVENLPGVLVRKWLAGAVAWGSPGEYLQHLGGLALGPHVAPLLGHSALRAHVMGLGRSLEGPAGASEIAAMRGLAAEALDAGCAGISIDMLPWHMMSGRYRGRTIPSQHAALPEYAMLADLCRERDAVFQVTPDPQRLGSFLDILGLALGATRRPLRVTVLSALDPVGRPGLWRLFPATLFVANRMLGGNVRFQTLAEPFTVFSDGPLTPLFEEFPAGVRLNDAEDRAEREGLWRSPGFRARFREEWTRGWRKTFHRDLRRMTVVSGPDPALAGRTFHEVAGARGVEPVDAFMDLLAEHDADLRWVATGANARPGPRRRLLRHPHILPGFTDAGAHARNLGFFDGALSLLREAVASGFLSPERAIARVTGEPARWFRLEAGVLEAGARADVCVLRPEGLRSPVPAAVALHDPVLDGALRLVKRGSEKIVEAVYVAGALAVEAGRPTELLGQKTLGSVLAPSAAVRDEAVLHERDRNRIDARTVDHPFTDYWDVFVVKHRHPGNVALHGLGLVACLLVLGAAWTTGRVEWLLGLPAFQLTGLLGHVLFERNHVDRRDAVASLRASWCLARMFALVATGRYGAEVARVTARLATFQGPPAPGAPGPPAA